MKFLLQIASLRVVLLCLAALSTPTIHAQTGRLNDTGQTSCYDAADAAGACSAATAGNAGTRPHQDGRYGRDVASPIKTGGGAAGFDFSCVLWNGTVINGSNCTTGLVANISGTASATPATDWACTKDNLTGLVWSLQSQGPVNWTTAIGATYPNAGHNNVNRCGYGSGWRVPTQRELMSILHNGLSIPPLVDVTYFPATQMSFYWVIDVMGLSYPSYARIVYFTISIPYSSALKIENGYVRLVRSAL